MTPRVLRSVSFLWLVTISDVFYLHLLSTLYLLKVAKNNARSVVLIRFLNLRELLNDGSNKTYQKDVVNVVFFVVYK